MSRNTQGKRESLLGESGLIGAKRLQKENQSKQGRNRGPGPDNRSTWLPS